MTDEVKRCVQSCREWYVAFSNFGRGNESSVKELLTTADLIESLSDKNKQLEYTLVGVMHFVDKWLDNIEPYCSIDDPSGQIAIDRAAEARRITLEHIEDLTREMYRRGQELSEVQRERDAAVEDVNMLCMCDVCTRPCKYDKPNPYCKCADFEWRGLQEK